MNNAPISLPSTRREFLLTSGKGLGLLAFSRFAPDFLVQSTLASTPAAEKDRTILVLVQLAGGNDGLNTVVPYEDDHYYRLRPSLGIKKTDVLPLNGTHGLHPACGALHAMLNEGKLGIIQNVGYPNPNRSHFRSTDIWETASESDETLSSGWLGRFLDNACAGTPQTKDDPAAVHITDEVPLAFLTEKPHPTFGINTRRLNRREHRQSLSLLESIVQEPTHDSNASFLKQTMMDALVTERRVQRVLANYKPATAYPQNPFGQSLHHIAALIASGFSTRVYFASLGGFDTHANQLNAHQNLLRTLSEGLSAFQKDLEAHQLDQQVTTMTFSEFGRRPMENESRGTDHGTAAPLFVMGSRVKSGLHGTPPSLDLGKNRDLEFTTDFRQVYATILDRWLECPAAGVLGKAYQPLGFL